MNDGNVGMSVQHQPLAMSTIYDHNGRCVVPQDVQRQVFGELFDGGEKIFWYEGEEENTLVMKIQTDE